MRAVHAAKQQSTHSVVLNVLWRLGWSGHACAQLCKLCTTVENAYDAAICRLPA